MLDLDKAKAYLYSEIEHIEEAESALIISEIEQILDVFKQYNFDENTKIAGLLMHLKTIDEKKIQDDFGTKIVQIVSLLNQIYYKASIFNEDYIKQIELIFLSASLDVRIILVHLSKFLVALRNIEHIQEENRTGLCEICINVLAPIAQNFGFVKMKNEFENLSFQFLHPKEFRNINAYLNERKEHFLAQQTDFIKKIETVLRAKNKVFEYEITSKQAWSISIKSKIQNKHYHDFDDTIMCRVVLENEDDCYLVLQLLNDEFESIDFRFKDYIKKPKARNGYQSLHAAYKVDDKNILEVQILTKEMYTVAHQGLCNFKDGDDIEHLEIVQSIKEIGDKIKTVDDEEQILDIFKSEMCYDQVHVYTPDKKLIKMPMGASIVDYAFAVSAKMGLICAGGIANKELLPIRYRLKHYDSIEILTSEHAKPNESWLKFCVTNKARHEIRSFVSKKSQRNAIILGQTMLKNLNLSQMKINQKSIDDFFLQLLQSELPRLHVKSVEDYYAFVGYGKIELAALCTHALKNDQDNIELIELKNILENNAKNDEERFIIAPCCSPNDEDEIIGMKLKSGITSAHRTVCSRIFYLTDKTKLRKIEWQDSIPVSSKE